MSQSLKMANKFLWLKIVIGSSSPCEQAVKSQYISSLSRHGNHGMPSSLQSTSWNLSQTRGRYVDWAMWKDHNRRKCVEKHAKDKLRVNALKRNTVLPHEIREMASKCIEEEFPRNAHHTRVVNRCVMTSRPRSVYTQWRMSRIVFRHHADYNKLSGVTRSTW